MPDILVICPTHRDHRELARLPLSPDVRFHFHDYASLALEDLVSEEAPAGAMIADPLDEIERILDMVRERNIGAVISTDDYPGTALASAVAARLGLPGPAIAANLECQHKYAARLRQRALVPDATPDFVSIDVEAVPPPLDYPCFVKPVKSFFSIGAGLAEGPGAIRREQRRWAAAAAFFRPFERLLERHAGLTIGTHRLIAETPLRGTQSTLEGFVFRGRFAQIGIVDSVMYPETLAFQRFEYPSSLPTEAQARMADIAGRLMLGIGFDDGLFNIEFAHDAETGDIGIIEVNPRMASQFADLYEKVDGFSSYSILLDLGLGREPRILRSAGRHAMAASCVLRCFENRVVTAVPSAAECAALEAAHPDSRLEVLVRPGRRLSQEMQDGSSYRYGILNLGGRDRPHILETLDACLSGLGFAFERIQTKLPATRAAEVEHGGTDRSPALGDRRGLHPGARQGIGTAREP